MEKSADLGKRTRMDKDGGRKREGGERGKEGKTVSHGTSWT
jgi:hypothetical protein